MKLQVVGLQRVRLGLAVNVFRVTAMLVSVGVFMRHIIALCYQTNFSVQNMAHMLTN